MNQIQDSTHTMCFHSRVGLHAGRHCRPAVLRELNRVFRGNCPLLIPQLSTGGWIAIRAFLLGSNLDPVAF